MNQAKPQLFRLMMKELRAEPIHTWFDLGLFLDKLKDDRKTPAAVSQLDRKKFDKSISQGIGFITYYYSVDGVTMEVLKYAKSLKKIFPKAPQHFIGGIFHPQAETLFEPNFTSFTIPNIDGFDRWKRYDDLFAKKLDRGGADYNRLICELWEETLDIVENLGSYIAKNKLGLLYLINTHSNPGNVSLALAIVLISEQMGVPVISNNHDFYWEGGASATQRKCLGEKKGPRDHFFLNSHLGEVFSIIEILYPWESRSWVSLNINRNQSRELVDRFGHNPANVAEVGTAVDTRLFTNLSKRRRIETFSQVSAIFSKYKNKSPVTPIQDVLEDKNFISEKPPVLLGAKQNKSLNFSQSHVVFLQPTRILSRKKIVLNFKIIQRLLKTKDLAKAFRDNPQLKVTLLITGPVAAGHDGYLSEVLQGFSKLLLQVDEDFKERIFLGLLFSEFDRPEFKKRFENPIGMPDIYGIASMVMLPSETEGRGLPILESAACGVPILTRRYQPEEVYAEVIGEHLSEDKRLKVIEFKAPEVEDSAIAEIKESLLFPQTTNASAIHNGRVIDERYSLESLQEDLMAVLDQLFLQLQPNEKNLNLAKKSLKQFSALVKSNSTFVNKIIQNKNRQYLPGYGQVSFMLMLKSLIDPSYFRVEEQYIRGMAMAFAKYLVEKNPDPAPLDQETIHYFYNSVDSLFLFHEGEIPLRLDHSMAYRHRNTRDYPYRDLTSQELTGVVNAIFLELASPPSAYAVEKRSPHHFADKNIMAAQLCQSMDVTIDHRDKLFQKLAQNTPRVYFPGVAIKHEMELLVLQPIRTILGLEIDEELTEKHLQGAKNLPRVYLMKREQPMGETITADALKTYLSESENEELKLLFKMGLCKIIPTTHISVGIDFRQLGKKPLQVIEKVIKAGGFLMACGDDAAMMTDIVNIDRFHIGKASEAHMSRILGIPEGHGYIQWVPAGLRTCLAYPTPIQSGLDFSETLKSPLFLSLCKKMGEENVLDELRRDAEEKGSPIRTVLEKLKASKKVSKKEVEHSSINGIYSDSLPWAGVLAKVTQTGKMKYSTLSAKNGTKTVLRFVEEFDSGSKKRKAKIAWNGGYILNPELVGKLGIPESYIGSPLGLIISSGKVLCPPLFNKPALLVYPDGSLKIDRVNCEGGLVVKNRGVEIRLEAKTLNPKKPSGEICFYNLLHESEDIPILDRVVLRLAGHSVKDIVYGDKKSPTTKIIPVGLTLSFPKSEFPSSWKIGDELEIEMLSWDKIEHAIEAGPLLLEKGKVCIDMKVEGWKTDNSIRTQAARLDYLDMRGPKIAVGLDQDNRLSVLTINGRIRESVGATHTDMADILKKNGMLSAMGFDPGGSSTLVVDGKTLNVSPYNKNYEEDVYSLLPEPRAVANVVIGY